MGRRFGCMFDGGGLGGRLWVVEDLFRKIWHLFELDLPSEAAEKLAEQIRLTTRQSRLRKLLRLAAVEYGIEEPEGGFCDFGRREGEGPRSRKRRQEQRRRARRRLSSFGPVESVETA